MNRILLVVALLTLPSLALAVPILQVGAPADSSDSGIYADYIGSLTNPTEEDTAVTSGSTLLVAGQYKNDAVQNVGGQFGSGENYSNFLGSQGLPEIFDTAEGAILLASIPEGSLHSVSPFSLLVNDQSAFYISTTDSFFPNSHAPVQAGVADFMFFNIGNFTNGDFAVPNFDEESPSTDTTEFKPGEIKTLSLTILGLDWVHFDVMALVTTARGTSLLNNPGSHDATWYVDDDIGTLNVVPEPSTIILLGVGLVGLLVCRRKQQ